MRGQRPRDLSPVIGDVRVRSLVLATPVQEIPAQVAVVARVRAGDLADRLGAGVLARVRLSVDVPADLPDRFGGRGMRHLGGVGREGNLQPRRRAVRGKPADPARVSVDQRPGAVERGREHRHRHPADSIGPRQTAPVAVDVGDGERRRRKRLVRPVGEAGDLEIEIAPRMGGAVDRSGEAPRVVRISDGPGPDRDVDAYEVAEDRVRSGEEVERRSLIAYPRPPEASAPKSSAGPGTIATFTPSRAETPNSETKSPKRSTHFSARSLTWAVLETLISII